MDSKLVTAFNRHLELEFNAFYKYMAMSHWLDQNDLPGFAQWMANQSTEELEHATKFIEHMLERDVQPVLPAVAAPGTDWGSVLDLVTAVYNSECEVTRAIGDLYELAEKAGDRPAQVLLQWFVSEQVEEENMAKSMLGRLRLADGSGVGLLMIDQELSQGRIGGALPTETGGQQ
ncbi:MAG: ferritin [Planctomycetota bacterium]